MVIDERELRAIQASKEAKKATPAGEARPCRRCGYDLRGLKTGGLCPECGASMAAPISKAGRGAAVVMNLTNAQRALLAQGGVAVGAGMLLLVGGLVAMGGYVICMMITGEAAEMRVLALGLAAMCVGGGALMTAGVWRLTWATPAYVKPNEDRVVREPAHLATRFGGQRWVARVQTALWPGAMACLAVAAILGDGGDSHARLVMNIGVGVVLLASLTSWPTIALLADTAGLVGDDDGERVLHAGTLIVPVGMAGLVLIWRVLLPFFERASIIGVLALLFTTVIAVVPMIKPLLAVKSMSRSCRWALKNANAAMAKEDRFREKWEARAREAEAARAKNEAAQRGDLDGG